MPIKSTWSWGDRLCGAFRRFSPPYVRWVHTAQAADVIIYHVDSWLDTLQATEAMRTKKVVVVQHGLRFADATIDDFASVWEQSLLTVSFQPLDTLYKGRPFPFLATPWGADPLLFRASHAPRREAIVIVGDHGADESHGEILFAAAHRGLVVVHVGRRQAHMCTCRTAKRGANPLCSRLDALHGRRPCDWYELVGSSDTHLIHALQTSKYAAALRKFEGFEMIGIEALFCGARPLVYNIDTYDWYRKHAAVVETGLTGVDFMGSFHRALDHASDLGPVTQEELDRLRATFDWRAIMKNIFGAIRSRLHEPRQLDHMEEAHANDPPTVQ